jgi:hypothetical protein
MSWVTAAVKYASIGLGVLFGLTLVLAVAVALLSMIFSLGFALFGILITLIVVSAPLVLIGALGYAAYTLSSDSNTDTIGPSENETQQGAVDPVEQVKQRYKNGDLSEQELERRLEIELDDPERDPIDRELERGQN